MNQLDFDRAFPRTPEYIHTAIELGLRKGKNKMKFRNKMIAMGSAAAVIAVVFAAALAMSMHRPETPDVVTPAALAGPEATHVLAQPGQETFMVYTTEKGHYYHLDEHCCGMENAIPMTEAQAMQKSKTPCPICIPLSCSGHDREEIEFVYYSQGGVYFHKAEECSGGTFALKGSYFDVTEEFPEKQACPVCFPEGIDTCMHGKAFVVENEEPETTAAPEEKDLDENGAKSEEYVPVTADQSTAPAERSAANDSFVYTEYGASGKYYHRVRNCGGKEYRREITESQAIHEKLTLCSECCLEYVCYTKNGVYYHSDTQCQGMMNASAHPREEARKDGKQPCPICLIVYCTEGGRYYHLLPDCMGMQNAQLHILNEALALNKARCPVCLSPETVYASQKGNYFHADQYCSGMEGASPTNPESAWGNGKNPCPVCITANEAGLMPTAAPVSEEYVPFDTNEETYESTSPVFYCTPNGKYYHVEPDCSGMRNAEPRTPEQVFINSGYTACPSCIDTDEEKALLMLPVPQNDTDEVFIAPGNSYYHRNHGCFYMSMVIKVDLKTAKDMQHTPCPMCFPDQAELTSFETCWSTKNGKYYHSEEHCSGMQNAVSGLVEEALSKGKMRCPVCMKTTPENYDLFTTAFGQEIEDFYSGYIYDHSAGSAWIISNGEESFELCEIYPEGTAFFGEELPGLAELLLSDALAAYPAQVDVFMKAAPAPIGSMYAAAPAEIEKQIRHEKITVEELQLMEVKVYFDANRQVSGCEMQFGFGDHVKLAWKVGADGQIEMTQSEFVQSGWG